MFITHERFSPQGIKYGFFSRKAPGSHSYKIENPENEKNNALISQIFGCEKIHLVNQEHTNKVVITNYNSTRVTADSQVTNIPKVAIGVYTADCVPILFVDEENKIISAVHAGWKGARSDLINRTITKMKEMGARKIEAIIGPCIRQESYEVDINFFNNFIEENKNNKKFFMSCLNKHNFLFDLPGYVKEKLKKENVTNIFDTEKNTYTDKENYFSYRRTTHNPLDPMGNIISVIMIE